MKTAIVSLLSLVFFLSGLSSGAAAETFVGVVKVLEGDAVIERSGQAITAARGMDLQQTDIVKTGEGGRIGLILSDDTRISLGPKTEIAIDDYLFDPQNKRLSCIVRMIRGTVSFLSGQIAKLSPESVQLVMPSATIGVRGTHVLIKVN